MSGLTINGADSNARSSAAVPGNIRIDLDSTQVEARWVMLPRSKLVRTAIWRGLRKRCPHCGEGRLFLGWSHLQRCSICGLVFARNPGDTWAFTILGDRLPIAVIIVLIYFGVVRSHPVLGLTLVIILLALLVWTAPNRWGAGIALHYLSRVYLPDPTDPVPPPYKSRTRSI
jgi:uncharacterized protein (DUF983 family)